MQAIILAAGMGKRLGELTSGNTKCMVKVNGTPLIDRMLSQLSKMNFSKIVLVVGYQAENLKAHVGKTLAGTPIVYVENPIYDKTNNIYSLALAKDFLVAEDTLLLESDLIVEDTVLDKILKNPFPNLALVSKYETWMDGTMVRINDDCDIVSFIPKSAFKYSETDTYYKTVNIYKFSAEFSRSHYVPFLDAYTKALGNNEYYEQVLRVITMLDKVELKALPLDGENWYEIDDVQDLDIAEAIFAEDSQRLKKYFRRYGGYWRFPRLLDFCYLVNPYFPSLRMRDELRANFDALLAEYPSGMSVNSLLAGKYFGVRQSSIVVGNGAAELIKSLMESLPGKLGVTFPTFEEYPNRRDKSDVEVFVPANPDFAYAAEDLKTFFADKEISALLLVNPDNPSGNFISKSEILDLAAWARERNIRLIVDESFVDFAIGEDNTLLRNDILDANPQLIVMKSISKSYGVPGLRLGVLASSDEALISRMKKDVAIWNINSFAEFYMQIFGKYEGDYRKACKTFIAERERFRKRLSEIPFLRVIPSQANYFLCEITEKFTAGELTARLLNEADILIKDCSTKAAFNGKNYIRLAVRDTADNDKLVDTLKGF